MSGRLRRLVGIAAIAACGPEAPMPPAEFEEICGSQGPHRLLALEEASWSFWVTKIGERLYFLAGEGEKDETWFIFPRPTTSTVYSTGLCGEEPVTVAEGVWSVSEHEQMPGIAFGCNSDLAGDLVALDPFGASAPKVIAAGACLSEWTDHGLVHIEDPDAETLRVLFYPYATDPAQWPIEPIVLLDEASPGPSWPLLEVFPDEVLALDGAGNIVRATLPDGAVTIEQSGVIDFEATERWLLWADRASAGGDPEEPEADILLRDRQTGEDTVLGRRVWAGSYPKLVDDYVRMSDLLLIDLPSLEVVDVPDGQYPTRYKLDDGRRVTTGAAGGVYLFDPSTGTSTLVTDDTDVVSVGPEWVMTRRGAVGDGLRAEGELWRHPYDGASELLARRASPGMMMLPEGGLVTLIGAGGGWTGRLVVVDSELEERELDDHVRAGIILGFGHVNTGPGTVLYSVQDGERSGVWVARPVAE